MDSFLKGIYLGPLFYIVDYGLLMANLSLVHLLYHRDSTVSAVCIYRIYPNRSRAHINSLAQINAGVPCKMQKGLI